MSQTLTRRGLVAAAPAAVVAAAMPALAATTHPDAVLLALRGPWLVTLNDFNAALDRKSVADGERNKRTGPFPTRETFTGGFAAYCIVRDRWYAEAEAIALAVGCDEADRLVNEASDANGAVVQQIEMTPARTLAGLAFKVEVSEDECHGREELIDSIMADIKALAAGGLDA